MKNLQDQFAAAFKLHRSGRIREAINRYLKILPRQKNNAQLLYLLGTAYLQAGYLREGITQVQKSLAIDPINPDALNNLGNALKDLQRFDEALASYDKALAIRPDHAEAHYNRGNTLKLLKRFDEALASYDKALAIRPNYAEAHYNRGNALKELERYGEALASYDKALAIRPNHAEAYDNRGNALRELQRFDEALASYDKALAIRPDHADAYNNRGNALRELGRSDEALASYDKALAIRPDHAEAYNNRGNALQDLNRYDEALASYDKVLAIHPDDAEVYTNRGNAFMHLKRFDEALASYDKALAIRPDDADAHWNKSLLLILTGAYLEGWKTYEWRLRKKSIKNNYYNFPNLSWRGQEDLRGKKLFIHGEQGLGDVILFCRYLPRVAELGVELIVEVPKPLIGLVSTLDCPMTLVAKGSQLPEFDAYCPMMSLPYAFKTTMETIPSETPYLHAAPDKVQAWSARLGERRTLRVGLAWSGSAANTHDHNRSFRLAQLRDLLALPDIEWHSLQKEYRRIDLDDLHAHQEIHQHHAELDDFSDTAALIACMDLVISVDTSVAHLAGALGKPVWVLLPCSADCRWLLDRSDSPWYPSAKLYRQPEFDDWESVLTTVTNDLSHFPP